VSGVPNRKLVAAELTQKTGSKVIAATDGMIYDLADLDKI